LDLLAQLGTTSIYNAIADLHISEITPANTMSSSDRSIYNSRFLVTDVNSSSTSRAHVLLPQPPVHNSCKLSTPLNFPCRVQPHIQPPTDSLPSLLNYLLLSILNYLSIILSAGLSSSLHNLGAYLAENTILILLPAYSFQWERVYRPLPRRGRFADSPIA
jgi:hypothetical protein